MGNTVIDITNEKKLLEQVFIKKIIPGMTLREEQKIIVKHKGSIAANLNNETSDVFFDNLFTFLESPTIVDIFQKKEEHESRRNARNKLFNEDKELFRYWETNKLRGGALARFSSFFQVIELEEGHLPLSEHDKDFILSFDNDVYESYDIKEKISCVENFTRICSELFKTFLESN